MLPQRLCLYVFCSAEIKYRKFGYGLSWTETEEIDFISRYSMEPSCLPSTDADRCAIITTAQSPWYIFNMMDDQEVLPNDKRDCHNQALLSIPTSNLSK